MSVNMNFAHTDDPRVSGACTIFLLAPVTKWTMCH